MPRRPTAPALALARVGVCLTAPLPALGAPPEPGALCQAAIRAAEAATGIPDEFLNAIGRVESGRSTPDGARAPWPWTINAAGAGHFYATKAEAIAAATAFRAQGIASLDVGCLQVNLKYHPDAFAGLDQAFDPAANAAYAARLLLSLRQETGSWPRAAAAYHSHTAPLGAAYQEKVLAAWAEPDPRLPFRARDGAVRPDPTPPAPGQVPATLPRAVAASAFGHIPLHNPAAAPSSPTFAGRSLASYRAMPVRQAIALAPRLQLPGPLAHP